MESFLIIIILLAGLGILHTYLFYPWWTIRRATYLDDEAGYLQKSSLLVSNVAVNSDAESVSASQEPCYFANHPDYAALPKVTVLMAVHNEEKVLAKKLDALLAQTYPGPYQILIGSDNSSDATNTILRKYASQDDLLKIVIFDHRQGKPSIINQLTEKAAPATNKHFYLLTDASVMLAPDVVSALIAPTLEYPDLAVIDARMIHTGMQAEGIGQTEDRYISGEVKLKQAEGRLWGYMMGPFGGCYALRADLFVPVPPTFLVDDFYLCLAAYEQGGKGISVPQARCYEGVGQELKEEFRRKVRISSGNWQNALRFRKQWFLPTTKLGFAFFSHKILRWLTPFLIIVIMISLAGLAAFFSNYWAGAAFLLICFLLLLPPVLDTILVKVLSIHWQPLRAVRYFTAMNLALLVGFFRYLKGIQSNVWQPTQRH